MTLSAYLNSVIRPWRMSSDVQFPEVLHNAYKGINQQLRKEHGLTLTKRQVKQLLATC